MGARTPDAYHAAILDDFIGQNWSAFINFIAMREDIEADEAETLADQIAEDLNSFL